MLILFDVRKTVKSSREGLSPKETVVDKKRAISCSPLKGAAALSDITHHLLLKNRLLTVQIVNNKNHKLRFTFGWGLQRARLAQCMTSHRTNP